jgi:hypothetical protein
MRVRKKVHTIGIEKLRNCQGLFFGFKEIPSLKSIKPVPASSKHFNQPGEDELRIIRQTVSPWDLFCGFFL